MKKKTLNVILKNIAAGALALTLAFSGLYIPTGRAEAAAAETSVEAAADTASNFGNTAISDGLESLDTYHTGSVWTASGASGISKTEWTVGADAYWDKFSSTYFYNQMNASEKALYNGLYAEAYSMLTGTGNAQYVNTNSQGQPITGYATNFVSYTGMTEDQAAMVGYVFMNANPQFYFLSNSVYYKYETRGLSSNAGLAIGVYDDFANGSARSSATKSFRTKLDGWMSQVNAEANAYAKIKKAHDIIMSAVDYDPGVRANGNGGAVSKYNQSSAGAFFEEYTVCAGYAESFELLMDGAGINCIAVTSKTHEWNEVYLDGAWYNVDVTYDDSGYGETFLCVSDTTLRSVDTTSGTHTAESFYSSLNVPPCPNDYDKSKAASSTSGTNTAANTGNTGSTGNTGGTENTGNTGNTGGTGNAGSTGNTGSTGNAGNTGNTSGATGTSTAAGPVYRLYNKNSGEHFYTTSTIDVKFLSFIGWKYEGEAWKTTMSTAHPVYRLYNKRGGEHFYTLNPAERDFLVKAGWKYERIEFYAADNTGVPVYRAYNPNATANNHNYTTNPAEQQMLLKNGWKDEGISWYGAR